MAVIRMMHVTVGEPMAQGMRELVDSPRESTQQEGYRCQYEKALLQGEAIEAGG